MRMAGNEAVLDLLNKQQAENVQTVALGSSMVNSGFPVQGLSDVPTTPMAPQAPLVSGNLKVDDQGIYGVKGSLQTPINKKKDINFSGGVDVNFPYQDKGQDPFGGEFTMDNPGSITGQAGISKVDPRTGGGFNLGIDYRPRNSGGGAFGMQGGFTHNF